MHRLGRVAFAMAAVAGCSAPVESTNHEQPPSALPASANGYSPATASRGHVCVVVPRDIASLHATQSGRVVKVYGRVGEQVKPGDPLIALEDGFARDALVVSSTRLREAGTNLDVMGVEQARSQEELERVEQLFREGVASHRELDDAASRAQAARLHVARAAAVLEARQADLAGSRREVEQTVLRAPVEGRIASRTAQSGSTVLAGTLLVRLISDETPMARCAIPARRAATLFKGTATMLNIDDVDTISAQVRWIAPEVDPISQLVIVEVDLSPVGPLVPGTAAWMHLL